MIGPYKDKIEMFKSICSFNMLHLPHLSHYIPYQLISFMNTRRFHYNRNVISLLQTKIRKFLWLAADH